MKTIKGLLIGFIILVFFIRSCKAPLGIVEPIDAAGVIKNLSPIGEEAGGMIEGIYKITEGSEYFGEKGVVQARGNHISIFCGINSSYFIMSSGFSDSAYYFDGFWRFSISKSTGKAKLKIEKENGGSQIANGNLNGQKIIISGYYIKEGSSEQWPFKMEYLEHINKDNDFYIIAHRGGGRNSDRLQASENSLELLRIAEYFGANSVEIDVQLTKDNVAILFHDTEFTPRLVNGNYLIGAVSNYSFKQIRTFGRLKNNELIPTLEEALKVIVFETGLRLVWIDVKDASSVPVVIQVQKKYAEIASSINKDLKIVLGLPDEEVLNAYKNHPDKSFVKSLCELDISYVRDSGADFWAPRWTDGVQKEKVNSMHSENKKVFVWTLDMPNFITDFLSKDLYDGILTNYPSIVAYEYYTKNK